MNNKIDFVITWVDGNDKKWQKEKDHYLQLFLKDNPNIDPFSYDQSRYRDFGTLKYWFRGVEKFADWVNKIYFVTNGQVPEWLKLDHEKLVVVKHSDFMDQKYLPTFSSEAIEVNLHHIKDLSENFVYFNDDLFIIDRVKPTDFFKNNLPCETALLGVVSLQGLCNSNVNGTVILNKHFNKKEVIIQNVFKWFNLKYGKKIIRTLLALPYRYFDGMTELHLCNSLKKSTFEKLWQLEPWFFESTSKNKFRNNNNVNLWLLKNFQICSGQFVPRKYNFGKNYILGEDNKLFSTISKQQSKVICINDNMDLSAEEFRKLRTKLIDSFEKILPQKSSFEK